MHTERKLIRVALVAILLFTLAWSAPGWHFSSPPPPPPPPPPDGPDDECDKAFLTTEDFAISKCPVSPPPDETSSLTAGNTPKKQVGAPQAENKVDPNSPPPRTDIAPTGPPIIFVPPRDIPHPKNFILRDVVPCGRVPLNASQPPQPFNPLVCILDVLGDDQVILMNIQTGGFEKTIDLAGGLSWQLTSPQSLATTPDGRTLLVTNRGDRFQNQFNLPHVTIISMDTRAITARVTQPEGVVMQDIVTSPDGALAYVGAWNPTNQSPFAANPRILVVDIPQRQVIGEIPMPGAPGEMGDLAITPDGALLFAFAGVEAGRGRIHVIDTRTRTVVTTVKPAAQLQTGDIFFGSAHLAMRPDGARLYVGPTALFPIQGNFRYVSALDTLTLTFIANENVAVGQLSSTGTQRTDLEVSSDGRDVFLNDALSGRLVHISTLANRLAQEINFSPNGLGPIFTLTLPPD